MLDTLTRLFPLWNLLLSIPLLVVITFGMGSSLSAAYSEKCAQLRRLTRQIHLA